MEREQVNEDLVSAIRSCKVLGRCPFKQDLKLASPVSVMPIFTWTQYQTTVQFLQNSLTGILKTLKTKLSVWSVKTLTRRHVSDHVSQAVSKKPNPVREPVCEPVRELVRVLVGQSPNQYGTKSGLVDSK